MSNRIIDRGKVYDQGSSTFLFAEQKLCEIGGTERPISERLRAINGTSPYLT